MRFPFQTVSGRKSLIGSSLLGFSPSGSDLEISCASNSTWAPSKCCCCHRCVCMRCNPPKRVCRLRTPPARANTCESCVHVSERESLSKHIDTPYMRLKCWKIGLALGCNTHTLSERIAFRRQVKNTQVYRDVWINTGGEVANIKSCAAHPLYRQNNLQSLFFTYWFHLKNYQRFYDNENPAQYNWYFFKVEVESIWIFVALFNYQLG